MSDSVSLLPGDLLRVERRYLVDGVISMALAEGRYAGVERVGSSELIALRGEDGAVKLIPLSSVSEITLVSLVPRESAHAAPPAGAPPAWDPGVV